MFSRSLLFLCAASGAFAQTEPLALDDAIRVAWAHDPRVAALALTPEIARAREEQAGLRPNPEVAFRGGMPLKGDSEWEVGVGLSQRLPRRERVEQARAFARLGGLTAELHLREQRRRVAGEVRRLYYGAVVQQIRRDRAGQTLEAQRELRQALEGRRTAGEISSADLALLGLETQRAAQTLAFAEAELAALTQRLRARLRLPAEQPLVLDSRLEALLERPLPGAPAALEIARPELALAAHEIRQAEAALALARAETRGDWTVGGGLDFERRANDYTRQLENEPRLSVSASVPWPLSVSNRGDIRERQAAVRIAEAQHEAVREELNAELAAATAAAHSLRSVIASHRPVLSASAEAMPDGLRAAFERGEVTTLQVAQARQQRLSLEADFLDAVARYAAALAEAETAAGVVPEQP